MLRRTFLEVFKMATYKEHKLTTEEKRQIESAHDRIVEILWRNYADAFSGDQAFFLHECALCFEQEISAFQVLTKAIWIEKMQPDISIVWEALNAIRRKWDPFIKGYEPLPDAEKLFPYLRKAFLNIKDTRNRKEWEIAASQFFDGCFDTIKSNDLNDIETDLALRQVVKNMKPDRRAEVLAVMRKWLFEDIGRDALTTALGWDQKRVSRVWKAMQKHRVREKMLE
jgi:hypothetical protein